MDAVKGTKIHPLRLELSLTLFQLNDDGYLSLMLSLPLQRSQPALFNSRLQLPPVEESKTAPVKPKCVSVSLLKTQESVLVM